MEEQAPAETAETGGSSAQPGYGVGPWPGGESEWPQGEQYDPELLAAGDTRNVIDRYRYWRMGAIVADLDTRRHPFHVAIENWQHDMNIGSIVRSANAFLADTVHIIGRRRWNKRGAMVTDRYQHVVHHEDVEDFAAWAAAEGIPIIAVDNVDGAVPVDRAELARVSKISGGEAYTATSAGQLKEVYKDIGSSVGKEKVDREVTSRYAGFGLGLAILAALGMISLGARWP